MLGIEPKVWAVEAWCGDLSAWPICLRFGIYGSKSSYPIAQPTWFKQLKQFQTFISETF